MSKNEIQSIKLNNVPFNITFLMPGPKTVAGLLPVKSMAINDTGSPDFHPQGLYSSQIFGKPGEATRDTKPSFIPLRTKVFHPLYFKELVRLKALYGDIILGRGYAYWDEKEKDFFRSKDGILDGETGMAFFLSHFDQLVYKQGESKERQLRIGLLELFRSAALIDYLIVIPAGLRDVQMDEEGRPVEDDINGLYRKVISASNTINPELHDDNTLLLDSPRRAIQRSVVAVYDYLFNIIKGKKGFIAGSWGSRRIFNSTRNVITAMEVDSEILGDPRSPDMNTTIIGLFQFLKAAEVLVMNHGLKKGYLASFFDAIGREPMLINTKTLKAEPVTLSSRQKDKWGTVEGLESLINGYRFTDRRHKPVIIDGHYLKLIYQTDKVYRIFDDISELPEGFNQAYVRPITWTEMFYFSCHHLVTRTRAMNTRYPITGLGSIYPSKVYLKTTTKGMMLKELDDNWQVSDKVALEFPYTVEKLPFLGTQVVAPSQLTLLGADYDGDQLSFTIVFSDESILEIDKLLGNPSNYLSPAGGLVHPTATDTVELVLSFMTGNGLKKEAK